MTSTAARRLFPVAALVLAACGGSGPASPPTPGVTVAALIVSPAQLTIAAGASGTLAAETRSASGNALAGRAVSWRSSNAAVATVSDGVVTAVAPGTALIIGASEGATDTAEVTVTAASGLASVGVGDGHACTTTSAGVAYCWGENTNGEAGSESAGNPLLTARAVLGTERLTQIAPGNAFSCALAADGRAFCWGSNGTGTLGDGSAGSLSRATPQPVSSALRFTQLSSSTAHACAVTAAGTAHCWGFNIEGEVGNGGTASAFTPQQVTGIPLVDQISAGIRSTCIVTRTREVWCWGSNVYGVLGDSTRTSRRTPARVAGIQSFTTVANSGTVACALDQDGLAWCWGSAPRVGDGANVDRLIPTRVASTERFVQVTASQSHVCARTADGRAFCWGSVAFAGIGDGTTSTRIAPTLVSGTQRFSTIGAGYNATCGVASDGVYCWGYNTRGVLGDGTAVNRLVPNKVVGVP